MVSVSPNPTKAVNARAEAAAIPVQCAAVSGGIVSAGESPEGPAMNVAIRTSSEIRARGKNSALPIRFLLVAIHPRPEIVANGTKCGN